MTGRARVGPVSHDFLSSNTVNSRVKRTSAAEESIFRQVDIIPFRYIGWDSRRQSPPGAVIATARGRVAVPLSAFGMAGPPLSRRHQSFSLPDASNAKRVAGAGGGGGAMT